MISQHQKILRTAEVHKRISIALFTFLSLNHKRTMENSFCRSSTSSFGNKVRMSRKEAYIKFQRTAYCGKNSFIREIIA